MWTEDVSRRTLTGKTWSDDAGHSRYETVLGTRLHYASAPDGEIDAQVDATPEPPSAMYDVAVANRWHQEEAVREIARGDCAAAQVRLLNNLHRAYALEAHQKER